MTADDEVDVDEAHDLLGDALGAIRTVKNDYPPLTDDLEDLLDAVDGRLVAVYLRLGREGESPPLTELADRYDALKDGGSP